MASVLKNVHFEIDTFEYFNQTCELCRNKIYHLWRSILRKEYKFISLLQNNKKLYLRSVMRSNTFYPEIDFRMIIIAPLLICGQNLNILEEYILSKLVNPMQTTPIDFLDSPFLGSKYKELRSKYDFCGHHTTSILSWLKAPWP